MGAYYQEECNYFRNHRVWVQLTIIAFNLPSRAKLKQSQYRPLRYGLFLEFGPKVLQVGCSLVAGIPPPRTAVLPSQLSSGWPAGQGVLPSTTVSLPLPPTLPPPLLRPALCLGLPAPAIARQVSSQLLGRGLSQKPVRHSENPLSHPPPQRVGQ